MKFKTKTYFESVELVAKMATLPNANVDAEIALLAFIFNQDLFRVGKDVMRFARKWNKLIMKDDKNG